MTTPGHGEHEQRHPDLPQDRQRQRQPAVEEDQRDAEREDQLRARANRTARRPRRAPTARTARRRRPAAGSPGSAGATPRSAPAARPSSSRLSVRKMSSVIRATRWLLERQPRDVRGRDEQQDDHERRRRAPPRSAPRRESSRASSKAFSVGGRAARLVAGELAPSGPPSRRRAAAPARGRSASRARRRPRCSARVRNGVERHEAVEAGADARSAAASRAASVSSLRAVRGRARNRRTERVEARPRRAVVIAVSGLPAVEVGHVELQIERERAGAARAPAPRRTGRRAGPCRGAPRRS